jgi:mannosyltransferase OCH1-like enzyme
MRFPAVYLFFLRVFPVIWCQSPIYKEFLNFSVYPYDARSDLDYKLDPLPPLPSEKSFSIPKRLWITMKSVPDPVPDHLQEVVDLNPDWEVHLVDDAAMNKFMTETFANTSLLWAFRRIHPELGAGKADIWRMAVVWRYGGCYIDSDSFIQVPLTRVIYFSYESLLISNKYFHFLFF